MSDYVGYLNGAWVLNGQIKIDPGDRGFMRGDVVFDVPRTFNGKSFRMKEHIDRLYRSLKYVRIDPGLSPKQMTDVSNEALRRNEHLRAKVGDFTVHQYVTRGAGFRAWSTTQPLVIVRVRPIDFGEYAHAYLDGMHGVVTRTRSYSPHAAEPKVKHFARMNFNLAEMEANDVDPGAWPILRDESGNLTEGSTYSVFIVTDGVLRTPGDRNILQGVSRSMVLDLARQLGIPAYEEDLQPYDLYTADETFFTTTSPCLLPVTWVDRRQIGDGKPGPVSKQLLAAWSEAVGVDIVDQALTFARR